MPEAALPRRLAQLDEARELAAYHRQPAQMRAAGPGKIGAVRLGFSRRGERSILHDLYRVTPLLVQRALYWDENMPEMPICSIISVGGGILQGDRYTIDITVKQDACAHVHTQGFTRIQQMDANYASQHQNILLEEGAYLEYMPDFTLPYRNSRYLNHTDITIAPSATLLYGEMVLAGRKHHHADERFGFDVLSLLALARRPDGKLLFHDKILFEKSNPTINFAAVMRGYDAFANVICLTPPEVAQRIMARAEVNTSGERAWSGVSALPNDAGLVLRAVGIESYDVRAEVRRFWAIVRHEVHQCGLPDEAYTQLM